MSRTRLVNEALEDLVLSILNFLLTLDQTKIISKLYDGTQHIQTIGNYSKAARVVIRVTETQKDILDVAETASEILFLIRREKTYEGMIKEAIAWKESIPRQIYEGSFTFLISEVIE